MTFIFPIGRCHESEKLPVGGVGYRAPVRADHIYSVATRLPEALAPLRDIAMDLGTAGDERARDLFRRVDPDSPHADDFLKLMAASRADFTLSFRRLSRAEADAEPLRDLFIDREALDAWLARWRQRLTPGAQARMLAVNPAVVLRNHLAEGAIRAAQRDDFTEIERLLKVLSRPFDEPALPSDAALPPDWASTLEVSCSS